MNKEEMKDKALHEIFRQMEKSVLPEDFNDRIMKRVYREQRRKEWRNVVLVAFTSVLLLIVAAYIFVHYFSFLKKIFLQIPVPSIYPAVNFSNGNDVSSGNPSNTITKQVIK